MAHQMVDQQKPVSYTHLLDPTSLGELIDLINALSKSFAIAIPHEEAMDVKDEVSFFQAVKARLAKFSDTGTGKTDEEIDLSACDAQAETTIRQVIRCV